MQVSGLAELLGLEDPPAWWADGLCAQVDPGLFFPDKGGSTREAKAVCAACPVRAECLEYALAHDERFGIWGGTSERERRRLKRGAQRAIEHVDDQADDAAVVGVVAS